MQQEAEALTLAEQRQIGLAEAVELTAIARLRERQAAAMGDEAMVLAIQREIDAREKLVSMLGDRRIQEAAQKSAEAASVEWEKVTTKIEDMLTDALMRGFESGKGFGENLGDSLVNLFKTFVAREIAKRDHSGDAGCVRKNAVRRRPGGGGGGNSLALFRCGLCRPISAHKAVAVVVAEGTESSALPWRLTRPTPRMPPRRSPWRPRLRPLLPRLPCRPSWPLPKPLPPLRQPQQGQRSRRRFRRRRILRRSEQLGRHRLGRDHRRRHRRRQQPLPAKPVQPRRPVAFGRFSARRQPQGPPAAS